MKTAIMASLAGAMLALPALAAPTEFAVPAEARPATVQFGCSVFGVPNGVTCELMRRDRILHESLRGLEVRHQPFEQVPPIMRLLAEGKIDVTSAADLPVLESASRRDIRIIGLVRVGYVVVVGPKGSRLADLKGMRIGYAPGTSSHYGILQALESVGLGPTDVTLIALSIDDMAPALLAGKIDAFSLHEPVPSGVIARYPGRYAALHRNLSFAYQVVAESFARRHPDAVPHVAAALARAVRWMRKDRANLALASKWMRQAAAGLSGKEPGFSEAEVIKLTRDTLLDIREAPVLPRNSVGINSPLMREVEFMRRLGKLPAGADWNVIRTAFDFGPMAEVMDNPKKFRVDEFDYEH